MPLRPPTALGTSAEPSAGPGTQLCGALGSPAPFHSAERAFRPEKKRDVAGAPRRQRGLEAVGRRRELDRQLAGPAAVGPEAPEAAGPRARHQRDRVARPGERLLDRRQLLADLRDRERVAAVGGAGERGGLEQRRHDLDQAGPRQQHLDLAEAVVGHADAAAQRAGALPARHLAVLERPGAVGGLRQPGDVRRARGVDGDPGVVAPAQEPRRRGGGRGARQAREQPSARRSSLLPCGEGYASGWRDGAGSLS